MCNIRVQLLHKLKLVQNVTTCLLSGALHHDTCHQRSRICTGCTLASRITKIHLPLDTELEGSTQLYHVPVAMESGDPGEEEEKDKREKVLLINKFAEAVMLVDSLFSAEDSIIV
ncbi:unnamed protein product [Caretta caretta]